MRRATRRRLPHLRRHRPLARLAYPWAAPHRRRTRAIPRTPRNRLTPRTRAIPRNRPTPHTPRNRPTPRTPRTRQSQPTRRSPRTPCTPRTRQSQPTRRSPRTPCTPRTRQKPTHPAEAHAPRRNPRTRQSPRTPRNRPIQPNLSPRIRQRRLPGRNAVAQHPAQFSGWLFTTGLFMRDIGGVVRCRRPCNVLPSVRSECCGLVLLFKGWARVGLTAWIARGYGRETSPPDRYRLLTRARTRTRTRTPLQSSAG